MIAVLENPDAQVIYKPHPDVMNGHRAMASNPDDVRHICHVLDQDIPLAQAFETIDHVYTITSQAGFEALMRGIPVTTLGCPFYSGWGLTDDRQPTERRQRKLSLEEVFAGAYILYPKYFDPIYKVPLTPEEAVDRLVKLRTLAKPKAEDLSPSREQPIQEKVFEASDSIDSRIMVLQMKISELKERAATDALERITESLRSELYSLQEEIARLRKQIGVAE